MTRITWNKATGTYTVANETTKVSGLPVKAQADCVKIELRNGMTPSFGVACSK